MNKTKKFVLKSSYWGLFGFIFWMAVYEFNIDNLGVSIFWGIVVGLLITFWNFFEYEKFNKISEQDFLESQHVIFIDNNMDNWTRLNDRLQLQIAKIKIVKITENLIECQIEQRITDSILKIEKHNNSIKLTIRKKYIGFLPDMAENYKVLGKLMKEQRNIPTT